MSKDDQLYWLIAVPDTKTKDAVWQNHNARTEKEGLCKDYRFEVPDFRVGTYDTLMSLSDDLAKIDLFVEGVTRKIARQVFDVVRDSEATNTVSLMLSVHGANLHDYLTRFEWDERKYPARTPLRDLTNQISVEVSRLEEELRTRSSEYQTISGNLAASERKEAGSLLVRQLGDIAQKAELLNTEYIATLLVVVPKNALSEWNLTYERLCDHVVPRSAVQLSEDQELVLFSVKLFRRFVDDFKNAAREKRFTVRDYSADPAADGATEEQRRKLYADKKALEERLASWCRQNFAEAFIAWIHLKAIRLFVESVLRYGLPINIRGIAMHVKKGNEKRLRDVLGQMYKNLGGQMMGSEEASGDEEFYPYVSLALNLDVRPY